MKRIIKYTLMGVLFGGVVSISSCTDLDETLYDQLNETNIDLSNEADVSSMMGQAIAQYRYLQCSWFGNWEMQEQCTDQYMVPYRPGFGWGDLYINLHRHDWDYNLGHPENNWGYAWTCIDYCNMVLDNLPEDNANDRAHMRFFRAMTYYMLLDSFRNVPLETTQDNPSGYLPEQNTPQEVFDFCVSEFQAIKDDIGVTKIYGYGNRYACCMALAKLYLNKGVYLSLSDNTDGYESALTEVNEVINSGEYTLSDTYSENFIENLDNNNEVIFCVPEDRTHAKHFQLDLYSFPLVGLNAYACDRNATNGSCAVPQFIDSYDPDDKRLGYTWTGGQQRYAVDNGDGTYTPNSGDFIYWDQDDWTGTGILTYNKEVHSIESPGAYAQEGYRMQKYEIVTGDNGTMVDDIPIFRYADALFIKAECLLRLGRDKDTAAQLVSQVRARAFDSVAKATRTVSELEGGSVYDYGHREYTCEGYANWDPSSYVYTQEGGDDIELGGLLDDLGWEFVGEMHRRQDLIRFKMKDGRSVFTGKSWFCKDAQTDNHWEIFAIPYLYMSGNMKLKQNPGYAGAE